MLDLLSLEQYGFCLVVFSELVMGDFEYERFRERIQQDQQGQIYQRDQRDQIYQVDQRDQPEHRGQRDQRDQRVKRDQRVQRLSSPISYSSLDLSLEGLRSRIVSAQLHRFPSHESWHSSTLDGSIRLKQ